MCRIANSAKFALLWLDHHALDIAVFFRGLLPISGFPADKSIFARRSNLFFGTLSL